MKIKFKHIQGFQGEGGWSIWEVYVGRLGGWGVRWRHLDVEELQSGEREVSGRGGGVDPGLAGPILRLRDTQRHPLR